ncbi:MAG: hypothetical protein PVG11_02835 [Anaerolineae bacterium]|jgi:hypothetical protein
MRNKTGLIMAILVGLGLLAGVGLGLLLGWVVVPVRYVDTSIADLAPEYRDEYMLLVASGYAVDGDLEKAQARLAELEVPNLNQTLAATLNAWVAEGRDEAEIRLLANLAADLGLNSPEILAYVASPTPRPTDTASPSPTPEPTDTATPTPLVPTATPVPPTDTPTTVPPSDTPPPEPTATDTPPPEPTATPAPPTDTPRPTNPPQPTNTPQPTSPPQPQWTWDARLVGPGEDGQGCGYGNLQIRVTVVNAGGNQINGVWVHDKYSQQYQVTGNVGSPEWGPGETKFEYGIGGGGSLCIAEGQGGACVSGYTRDMPCYYLPPVEDLYAAGYCNCCEQGASLDRCRQLVDQGTCFPTGAEHFSWRVVFRRNW